MFKKPTYPYVDYHVNSKNSKALLHIKNAHLNHYKDSVVAVQKDVGLANNYSGKEIPLLKAMTLEMSFQTVLKKRKSSRDFSGLGLSLLELSTLLHFACGYQRRGEQGKHVPSSGGFNSVETFVIILHSKEISKGIYYYNPLNHSLIEISSGNFGFWLENFVFYQKEWSKASAVFVLTSNTNRLCFKYGNRAYRLSQLDVEHVSQNLYLTSSAMNLKCCASGGFIESEIDNAIGLDGIDISSLLTVMVGK